MDMQSKNLNSKLKLKKSNDHCLIEQLFELILSKFKAERERYDYLMSNKKEIDLILSEGAEKAMKTANEVMNRVRKKLGY